MKSIQHMRKLTLKKRKIAAITNANFIMGGGENSNEATMCNNTGDNSVTCETNCMGCYTSNANSPCNGPTPGTTRANTGKTATQHLCPNGIE